MIKQCTCINAYQDSKYGKGNRVHNQCKTGTTTSYRCTVCGTIKTGGSEPKK